jgi:SAM-dependent methyltransferase
MTTNDLVLRNQTGELLSFYADNGLNVETYDQRTATPEGEIDFYVRHALASGGPVLELGSGTGRVTWPIGRAGVDIVGLDRSQGMRNVAERKRASESVETSNRVRFVGGDMTDFELNEKFALAIIPFRAFLMLLTPEAERSTLVSIRRHLKPGGRLIVDIFDPRLDLLLPENTRWRQEIPDMRLESGNVVSVQVLDRVNDPVRQTLSERWRFIESTPSGEIVRQELEKLEVRWMFRYEMRYLLELAGFVVEEEMSDFFGAPPAYARAQIWVATAT